MINNSNLEKPYTEGFSKPYDDPDREECSICSDNDPFTYKSWVKLGCSHYFHRHCIDLWIHERSTCPLCIENVYESRRRQQISESSDNMKWPLISMVILMIISFIFLILKPLEI